ncbi:hypothetical protein OG21DRAFT_1427676 [Imleria badia]|nr:hypothetical protein OG21DRAFT_1427676 [Imleria badia]
MPTPSPSAAPSSHAQAPNPALHPSPLSPACRARDRLLQWSPVHPCTAGNSQMTLSDSDIQRIYNVISHAWANSTKETYGSGLLAFHIFCDSKGIPEPQRAPADAPIIAAFISTLAGSYSGSAIANYVSGIRAWHTIHGLDWSINDNKANALLKAASSLAPPRSKRAPREPYTVDTLLVIRCHLDLASPLHAAVFACLTTAFYTTARTGELTVKTLHAFDPLIHIKPSDVTVQHDRHNNLVTNFHLPRTKSAPAGEDISWAKQDGLSDPQAALENHMTINSPPPNGPLFAYRRGQKHVPLTRGKFLSLLASALKASGRPPLHGHGIRIGSTLEYLLHNLPFNVVKVKGRWGSDAFLAYLHCHAQILAPYIQAQPSLHETFLRLTLPPVR